MAISGMLVQSFGLTALPCFEARHPFRAGKSDMPKFVIERDIPNVGDVTSEQVIAISQKSCSVLNNLGPKIQWLHSYVT